MTDPDDEFMPAPKPRRAVAQRARTLAKWTLGTVAVVGLLFFVSRWQVGRLGQRQLDAATRRLDAAEPGWRLDAILAAREQRAPAQKDDAAALVLELAADIPPEWNAWQAELAKLEWWHEPRDNHKPTGEAVDAAKAMADSTRLLRVRALALAGKTGGTYPLTVGVDPIAVRLPHLDKARRVASLLQYDGDWETLHGNPNRGIAAARAALGVARSIGDEPMLISQLTRMAMAKVAANTALQALAWGKPTAGLAELQAELLAEADVPWFQYGMRGERATLDRLFEGLESGAIPIENALRYTEMNADNPVQLAAFRAYKALIPGDRAKCLELCTEYVAASKLPPHEQLTAIKRVELPGRPPEEFRYLLTRLLLPACERVAEAGLRVRGEVLCAAACVACERYRRKHNRFPDSLAAVTPEFLPAVPANPFDGNPLRFNAFPDRVAVCCFLPDARQRQPNTPADFRDGDTPGQGYGYRLWAPDQRGLPPKPAEKVEP